MIFAGAGCRQGDQIGRIFEIWAIFFLGHFVGKYRRSPNYAEQLGFRFFFRK
jgi:hypothetical protein